MNWVEFQGTTFNLDQVTHFEITGSTDKSEIRAKLNIWNRGGWVTKQADITVAKGTKQECETWRNEIIAGQHNLPCKGHLYPIREHLNTIGAELRKITASIEGLSQKQ